MSINYFVQTVTGLNVLKIRSTEHMKGKGIKLERETSILFNDADAVAEIWTASETQYRRLLKRGWKPVHDEERHAEFTLPKKYVRVGKNTEGKPKKLRGFGLKQKNKQGKNGQSTF